MAVSSSCSQKCDVFPSFRGEDVRTGFLSHLLEALNRSGSINTFKDHGIERSRQIGPELLLSIREARISIVIFSKNYASSKWCLDELAEIHHCWEKLNQMIIPVFYGVDPSEVRKQNGEFGKVFTKTCEGKTDVEKQRWIKALTDVANLAGEHLQNWPDEASMVKKIATDVFDKLFSTPSNGFGDFVGIEEHLEAMKSRLCLESKDARMIGIWGQSGIGKSTLGRALFTHLSPQFPLHAFLTYKSTDQDVTGMKLFWEKQLLDEILDKNIKENRLGMVELMLKHKKVLIVLDDVVDPLYLETLVGKTEWFGPGSRIIVITQDIQILNGHKIDLLYELKIPAQDVALTILCRSAFAQDSPLEGFKQLAVEVARLVGNLPLGLRVLGSSLKRRTKEEWKKLLLQKGLKGDIMKTLKASYDRLEEEDQDIFLYIASLFNGMSVKCINDFFGDDKGSLERLAEKSLIRITPNEKIDWQGIRRNEEIVEMHNLVEKLGKEIVRAESKSNPGKRRFLTDAEEIEDVFTHQTGTETVLGIFCKPLALKSYVSMDEKSFNGMFNLQFLKIHAHYILSQPNVYLPPKLKLLDWDCCPLKCLPSKFKAEFLVELRMEYSELEKLWEGTQQLGSLKTIIMRFSKYLKDIPDLSKAINLERLDFSHCHKLESFPDLSKARKLERVDFSYCNNLESFPSPLNSEFIEYLNLVGCPHLKNFPEIRMESLPHGIVIKVQDCLWNKFLPGLDYLDCLRRLYPIKFLPEHLVILSLKRCTMEKLCEGVQLFGSVRSMDLSNSEKLKEIPDLSKATNLKYLNLYNCKRLVRLPSTIGNLQKLDKLEMENCTGLKVLPVDVNLSFLTTLNLRGCSSLTSFPQLSRSIEELYLDDTAIEEVHCCIEMFRRLTKLSMRRCNKLKNISPNIFKLENLKQVYITDCGGVITASSDATLVATIEDPYENIEKGNKVETDKDKFFNFENCFKLEKDARGLIIQSSLKWTMILPGGEVPTCFKHRAYGNSLTVTLPQSFLSHEILRFNVCVVVDPLV